MITTCVPHRDDPVAGRFVADMAEVLAARGHEVSVVAAARREGRGWDDPIALQGVTTHLCRALGASLLYDGGAPERLDGGLSWLRAAGVAAGLAAIARRSLRRCDALVSHFLLPSTAIAGALRGARPHLSIAHGSDALLVASLPSPARRALRGCASARWYSHPGLARAVGDLDDAAIVRPMGVTLPERASAPPRAPPLRVATVGRLVPVKGVARAIDAVIEARARGLDLSLDVIGDGPLRASLVRRAAALASRVRFHGALSPGARDRALRDVHVLLHPATELDDGRTEGAPLAVIEAMAAGRTVIATDAGGVAWLVGDAGVVLPARASAAELADVLCALDGPRLERYAALGRARSSRWSWDEVGAAVERALERS